jgi:restriction endonuclease Mrr
MDVLPKTSELMFPTLQVLKHKGPMKHSEIESAIVEVMSIPSYLRSEIRSGNRTELNYRLSWARSKAKSFGYVERDASGVWHITDLGIKFTDSQ